MDIKQNIANNIIALRKKCHWTQAELADRINYSDKAVSKWERGEAVPDIDTLYILAGLFGVTVDYFLHEVNTKEQKEYVVPKIEGLYKKLAVVFLLSLATALIALIIFIIGNYRNWDNKNYLWMAFVYCTPIFATITYIFFATNHIWLGSLISFCSIVLTITACVYLELLLRFTNLWMIWFIALILIGAVVLIFFMKRDKNRRLKHKDQ